GITTVPEFLDIRFGGKAQAICNVVFLLAYMFQLLPIILYTGAVGMNGILDMGTLTGISNPTTLLWTMIWVIGIIGSIYALFGGLRSIVVSDLLNGIGLLTGGLMITFFGLRVCGKIDLSATGSASAVANSAPSIVRGLSNLGTDIAGHLNSIGPDGSLAPFMQIFTGIVLINLFYWCTNQQIIQRTLAASSLKEGQKGVLLTGLLKLIGPLYLVLPGIMAFFLFRHGALQTVASSINPETGEFLSDHAYGDFVRTVLPPWLTGFFAAVMAGAVLSSFNSALNSTCTLFSLGIYKRFICKDAPDLAVVRAGKYFGLVIAVCAMCVAPLLSKAPSIFDYLQKMNAIYFIPIFAVVLLGLLSKRTPESAAVFGLAGGILMICAGYFILPHIPHCDIVAAIGDYHFVGLSFLVILDAMLLVRIAKPRRTAFVHQDVKAVDLTPWRGAKFAAIALLLAVICIYAVFADFSVLRDAAGKLPFGRFFTRYFLAILPTVILFVIDRKLDSKDNSAKNSPSAP
ncbi:MAG: solute:sodium symporter family transporter, partial [Kiritimatiellia bacterium]